MKGKAMVDRIRIEVNLPVTLPRAWAFLTKKVHMTHWWGDHVSLQARLGGQFLERWSDGSRQIVTSGKIMRWKPPVELQMTWADSDWPGDTMVVFRLSEQDKGTRIVLEHSGWSVHPEGSRHSLIDAHANGWSQHLASLVDYATDFGP